MLQIAMLSAWHVHAEGYANHILQRGDCAIRAVWDEDAQRGGRWAAQLSCRFEPHLDTLLADPSIDAVIVNAPTNLHGTVIRKAAEAGKHIFTEKVLTPDTAAALAVREAIRKNGVRFTISFPMKASRRMQFVRSLCDSGRLGTLTFARMRNVHSGSIDDWLPAHFYDRSQCAGGAMIDLGAHPMYLLTWLLGEPDAVRSAFANITDRPVEDNAVSVLSFPGGAIGVAETGFVSTCDPFIAEVSGTKGYVRVTDDDVEYRIVSDDAREWVRQTMPGSALPGPLDVFLDGILHGTPEEEMYGIDAAVQLTRVMERAYA